MAKQYLLLMFLATACLLVGCESLGIGGQAPTAVPFRQHSAQDVFNAFQAAGATFVNPVRDQLVGRGAPSTFSERYTFEIDRIAPLGGQVLVFDTPEAMAEWQTYIERLRADSSTRRDVVYVYTQDNVMLQVNANLLSVEAAAYRDALANLGTN
jgi:hypothetical protein